MKKLILTVSLLFLFVGCAPKYQTVSVPPRIDLKEREVIGVIQFDSTSKGKLAPLATRRFTESARRDQGLVRMVHVGPQQGRPAMRDVEALKALGRRHGVQTLMVGRLEVSDIRPNVNVISSLKAGSLTALVDATLAVDMIETETGASIWSRSASVTTEVGHISVYGKKQFAFNAEDPDRAYGAMIDALVNQVTRDFHVGWVRRPVQ